MSLQDSVEQYSYALKLGQKNYRECVARGVYPYPQVLDEILDEGTVAGVVDIGIVNIPSELICGTKSGGRRNAFAANFMPLLPQKSEFSAKWEALCAAHLSDEGIREPISCYEYMGRFYVQEGHKRVSVLKSFNSPSIPGHVKRVIPKETDEAGVRIYYEFMHFHKLSGLYQVYFSRPGAFAKLQAALGFEAEHVWTEDERRRFVSAFYTLRKLLEKRYSRVNTVGVSEAMLVWLQVYSLEELRNMSQEEISKALPGILSEVYVRESDTPIAVNTEPEEAQKGMLGRLYDVVFSQPKLSIAFINECTPERSYWVMAHDIGRQQLEEQMGESVSIRTYTLSDKLDADAAMEAAIADGAKLIFTTTARLIIACRRAAAKHKGLHIFNCSVSMPYPGVRSYYCRIYEGKFISGAIAGAMSRGNDIGYVASSPIFGVCAGINAFALGAQMTNPEARIHLRWSSTEPDPISELIKQGVEIISNRDIPYAERPQANWGLSRVLPDGSMQPLASPYWNWGDFYVKVVKGIQAGTLDEKSGHETHQAINYWWGMRSGVVNMRFSEELPLGVRQLAETLRSCIIHGSISPFERRMTDQSGNVISDGSHIFTPEEILNMDWLCENVCGKIPSFDELMPMSQPLVRLLGIYRDSLPPEKEGQLL